MQLNEEQIRRFYAMLIEIIEEKYNVKIEYKLIKKKKKSKKNDNK